jgi:hypothetical protein
MMISTREPIAGVARDLGSNDGALGNGVNAWRREHPEPDQPRAWHHRPSPIPVSDAKDREVDALACLG